MSTCRVLVDATLATKTKILLFLLRHLICFTAACGLILWCCIGIIADRYPGGDILNAAPMIGEPTKVGNNEELINKIVSDGHNDFPIWIRAFYQNHIYQRNFTQEPELYGQVDFPRLRQGRLRGQFWSVYVEW